MKAGKGNKVEAGSSKIDNVHSNGREKIGFIEIHTTEEHNNSLTT